MKKNPQRYPSVTALAEDVRHYLTRKPISARPDTLAYRAAKFAQRHTRALIAAAATAALLAGLIGFYTARLAAERDRARVQALKAEKVSDLLTGLLTGRPLLGPREEGPDASRDPRRGRRSNRKELAGEPSSRPRCSR
jgi:serine/threonine-protein kinase